MKRKIFGILFALVLVTSLSLVYAVSAGAQGTAVFQSGGDRLVALQNTDGGWDWPLDDGNPATGSADNTIGPIGIGLAQAYRQTGDSGMYTALGTVGAFLLTKTNNFTCWDGYLAVELDSIIGGTTYTDFVKTNFYDKLATTTYERKQNPGVPIDTDGYIAAIGYAWDLGIGLASAVAVGIDQSEIDKWITGVTNAINALTTPDDWFLTDLAGGVYGLAYAGETAFPGSGHFAGKTTVAELAAELASLQDTSGVFDPGHQMDIQNTAYALLALNEVNRSGYLDNISRAGAYLVSVQLVTGGWENYSGEGENNEMTAEALWALSKVTSGSVSMSAETPQIVAINVTPTSIDFGTLYPGQMSPPTTIDVVNIGTVVVDVTTSIVETGTFFADNLYLDETYPTGTTKVPGYNIFGLAVDATKSPAPNAWVEVPSDYEAAGTVTGTLVFEATQSPP